VQRAFSRQTVKPIGRIANLSKFSPARANAPRPRSVVQKRTALAIPRRRPVCRVRCRSFISHYSTPYSAIEIATLDGGRARDQFKTTLMRLRETEKERERQREREREGGGADVVRERTPCPTRFSGPRVPRGRRTCVTGACYGDASVAAYASAPTQSRGTRGFSLVFLGKRLGVFKYSLSEI